MIHKKYTKRKRKKQKCNKQNKSPAVARKSRDAACFPTPWFFDRYLFQFTKGQGSRLSTKTDWMQN